MQSSTCFFLWFLCACLFQKMGGKQNNERKGTANQQEHHSGCLRKQRNWSAFELMKKRRLKGEFGVLLLKKHPQKRATRSVAARRVRATRAATGPWRSAAEHTAWARTKISRRQSFAPPVTFSMKGVSLLSQMMCTAVVWRSCGGMGEEEKAKNGCC